MSNTRTEIFDQYNALEKTLDYLDRERRSPDLTGLLTDRTRVVFMGAGSSYSISKSAAKSLRRLGVAESEALAAGDVLVNTAEYVGRLDGALIVVPTRSGQTSEVLRAIERLRRDVSVDVLSICAVADSPVAKLSNAVLELPWAFDQSVCQTRTVTNLYAALIYVVALLTGDDSLISDLRLMCTSGRSFMDHTAEPLTMIARRSWSNVVVLADGVVEGIAEEGALAFKEICRLPSNHHNVLDSRHGPAVLFDETTLVVAFLSDREWELQSGVIADYRKKGCTVVTVGASLPEHQADLTVGLPDAANREALGVPFIFVPQLLSLEKAATDGIDPDNPTGLTAWIKL